MSPAVRTLSIQSQSTRLPVLTMPTLLLFAVLFVQRIASLLIHWNIDADYDLDLEQDNPCQMDGLQLNNTSCSHTVVADTINTGISVSSTSESATLEATRGTYGNISPIVPSALPYATTVFPRRLGLNVEEHQGLGGTLNISYDSASDGPSRSHTRLVDDAFAVIPTGGTPPTKTRTAPLSSSKPNRNIQDDPTVIYETSFESTSDAQYHFATNSTPKDNAFPISLESNEVLRSVDALAQGQNSRMATSNIEPSTDQVVKHITCNSFSIERRDPSIGPAINISGTSKSSTNGHTFGGNLSVTETPICSETGSHPVGVVLLQFQDPCSGQAISIPLGSDSIDRGAIVSSQNRVISHFDASN
jgi:hypothetical protein